MVRKPLLGGIALSKQTPGGGGRLNQCCTFLWTFLLRKIGQEYLLYLMLQEVPLAETSQWQRQVPFYHMMNELICVKVWSLCPSIHTWRTLMRVYWSCFNQASLIYLCLKAAVVRSLWSLRYCWPQQGLSQSGPSLFFFLFFFFPPERLVYFIGTLKFSETAPQLAEGITGKSLQTPDVFPGSAQRGNIAHPL